MLNEVLVVNSLLLACIFLIILRHSVLAIVKDLLDLLKLLLRTSFSFSASISFFLALTA